MAKEFFASAKFKMKLPDALTGVSGGLIFPAGIALPVLDRRDLTAKYPHLRRRLLDPQVYLAGLNVNRCEKACANLASYGWFAAEVPPYNSSEQKRKDWSASAKAAVRNSWRGAVPAAEQEMADAIRICVETQQRLGCEAIILPSPLTTDPASPYEQELVWLDMGLDIAARAGNLSRIASVAISDTCLRGIVPDENALLDVVVDQVSARAPEGAYIVIEQANEDGYYITHPNTIGALLRLVHGLKTGGVERVIVAYAGIAGLLALSVGADTWSTGWYRGERRLRLVDFEQQEGRAMPAYYSHPLAGEFHLESDLDRVVARGFLPRIADATSASEGLIAALSAGRRTNDVAEWRNTPTNVAASIEHFLSVAARETAVLAGLSTAGCEDYAQRWLDVADQLASALYTVGSFNPRTSINHQRSWREAFTRFLESR